jgi:hypothetical protein
MRENRTSGTVCGAPDTGVSTTEIGHRARDGQRALHLVIISKNVAKQNCSTAIFNQMGHGLQVARRLAIRLRN